MAKKQATKTEEPKQKPVERRNLEKKADGTLLIKISIPWTDVEKARESTVDELVKSVEIPGFRKGNIPRKIAEEKLPKEKVHEELLKKILTQEYVEAVKALGVKPIINPKIHVEEFDDGTALEFQAETCEEPEVVLNNYKEEVKKIKPASTRSSLGEPAPKIILPHSKSSGQEESEEPSGQVVPVKKLDEILDTVLSVSKITIPKILIEQEANRLLSQLLDELKKLGVSLEQYLASREKTGEQLRAEYEERAEKDLKLEFLLRKIADEEKIIVEEKDIQEAISSIKDEKQKESVSQNPYLLASIIRQQKTLDFLTTL